ncbi:MAG: hypothetical protein GY903_32295 [Fuerstiella sp.]|nr:hypothetical protein [Fuerstiella sp.]MCP4859173.1 hypothetical protein [Fuerstiella sp.]
MKKQACAATLLVLAALLTTSFARPAARKTAAFALDFQKLKNVTQASHWEVLSNHTHDDLVLRGRAVHSHRIVAVCRIARNGQSQLTSAIEEEIDRQMQAAGAISKGEWSAHHAKWTNAFGADESINITAPRIQFSVNGHFGVLDLSVSAHNGHAVISISCTH